MMPENSPNDVVKLCTDIIVSGHSTNQGQLETIHPQSPPTTVVPVQADTDEQLISIWLHGKSKGTQRYYRADVEHFFAFINKHLKSVILSDLQKFADSLENRDLVDGTKRKILSSVKSLISFAHKLGYLPFDISRPLILPTPKDTLNERILSESTINQIIDAEHNPRNKLILKLLYVSGVRVSELSSLKWKDFQERPEGSQITVFGKGSKTRTILLPNSITTELVLFRNGGSDEQPIFRSRKGGHLHICQILRIVKKAAVKAGLSKSVCCHTFRHSHSSAALENHCPIHLLQATLGHSSIATTGRYLHARPTDSSSKYLNL